MSGTKQRPSSDKPKAPSHRTRTSRSAMLQLPTFNGEPVCGDSDRDFDDLLLSGSDDEYYESPGARICSYERHARLFLEGRRPLLLSAALRGPFGRDGGWQNPWQGRGHGVAKGTEAQHNARNCSSIRASTPPLEASTNHEGQPKSPARPEVTSIAGPIPYTELGISPNTRSTYSDPEPKKRAVPTDWLRRRNLKRMRAAYDDQLTASPSAGRRGKTVKLAENLGLPVLTRSVSAPVQERMQSHIKLETGLAAPNSVHLRDSVSHVSDTERSMSVPFDASWESHTRLEAGGDAITGIQMSDAQELPGNSKSGNELDTEGDNSVSAEESDYHAALSDQGAVQHETQKDSNSSFEKMPSPPRITAPQPQQERASQGVLFTTDNDLKDLEITQLPEDQRTALYHKRILLPEDETYTNVPTVITSNKNTVESEDNYVSDDIAANVVEPITLLHEPSSDPATMTATIETGHNSVEDERNASPETTDAIEAENDQVSAQNQSPWTRPDVNTTETANTVGEDGDVDSVRETDKVGAGRDTSTALALQSPWTTAPAWQLPAYDSLLPTCSVKIDGNNGLKAENSKIKSPAMSLSQNPWASTSFSSSLSNLPTSPCSPSDENTLPEASATVQREANTASHPAIPIPSSGTAPSTPETKQSSLPTPDMTVSIKSFRIFHPLTPTPPPRRRNQKTGLRSCLALPRRKSGAASCTAKPSRRVSFDLPEDIVATEEGIEGTEARPSVEEGNSRNNATEIDLSGKTPDRLSTLYSSALPPQRIASPPPEDAMLVGSLPNEVEKFQDHFAAIAERAKGQRSTTLSADIARPRPLPMPLLDRIQAKPLDISDSPAVDAMASRFLEVDAETSKLQGVTTQQSSTRDHTQDIINKSVGLFQIDDRNKENTWSHERNDDGADDGSSEVDDVREVMDNLDEFLCLWEMDAEIAQVRASRV